MRFKILILIILILLAGINSVKAGSVYNDTILNLVEEYWNGNYQKSIAIADNYLEQNPDSPLGYFIRGAVYQSISENFRNDSFKEDIYDNLDRAIELCDSMIDLEPNKAKWPFIAGAAYGYRGLHKAFHGSWWGAFRDGLHCSKFLNQSLALDSTYYDAYYGLGSYHYYKTIKSRSFLWLPFVSDQREQGQDEIRLAIEKGQLVPQYARNAFLRIYYFEEKYEKAIFLADSLLANLEEPYRLQYLAEALIALERVDDAEQIIERLRNSWAKSSFYDSLGSREADFLTAKIYYKRGETSKAQSILKELLDNDKARKENAYYDETCNRVEEFYDEIR